MKTNKIVLAFRDVFSPVLFGHDVISYFHEERRGKNIMCAEYKVNTCTFIHRYTIFPGTIYPFDDFEVI